MKNSSNRFLFVMCLLLIILMSSVVQAANPGYTIENYKLDIEVTEKNLLKITETIDAMFIQNKHGIIRDIPKKNEVVRLDGSKESNVVQIKNARVKGHKYEISQTPSLYSLKIGDPNKTVNGQQVYIITYDYQLPEDQNEKFDELYFNLIGNEWDTTIKKVEFSIKMPKDFDTSKVGFSSGKYGIAGTNNINYTVNENVISGTFNQELQPGNALTIRVELEDGYFKGSFFNLERYGIYINFIVLVFVSFLFWYKYGKEEKTVDTVEFYPPENFNSAEIDFLYNGKVTNKGIISLIVNLANKGYIKIHDLSNNINNVTSQGSETYVLEKLCSYGGNNSIENAFMNMLFGTSNSISSSKLKSRMESLCGNLTRRINSKENMDRIFEKKSLISYFIIILCMLIVSYSLFLRLNKVAILVVALSLVYSYFVGTLIDEEEKWAKIASLIFLILIVFVASKSVFAWDEIKRNFKVAVSATITLTMLGAFFGTMKKRNMYGVQMLGRIKGFKNFIKLAKKEEIEKLIEENPQYTYDILPYAYVLGVTSVYMQKFEPYMQVSPDWYFSQKGFSKVEFESFINTMHITNESAASPSSSSSSSSSGGGFSSGGGGGFSGGGSGGGGGRSW